MTLSVKKNISIYLGMLVYSGTRLFLLLKRGRRNMRYENAEKLLPHDVIMLGPNFLDDKKTE